MSVRPRLAKACSSSSSSPLASVLARFLKLELLEDEDDDPEDDNEEVLSEPDEFIKQLVRVGHVEVTGNNEITRPPVVLAQERMAILNLVFTVRAVPQVSQKQFSGERHLLLQKRAVL